jgi:AraC-like DNA-binding protein
MGQMNGYQFCQKVRSNPVTCHIPLLLLTAKSDPVSQSKGHSVGANDYITKPVDQEVLISRIDNQLDHIKNIRASIIKQHDISSSSTRDKLITRFFHYIEANFANSELLIKDISIALHVSIRQLERKIRYFIDMTPNEYLNEYRLLRARELLLAGKSIHKIYDACGFSSHAYFSQRYKQRFLKTPSAEQKNTTQK